jgi:hypothetical protein
VGTGIYLIAVNAINTAPFLVGVRVGRAARAIAVALYRLAGRARAEAGGRVADLVARAGGGTGQAADAIPILASLPVSAVDPIQLVRVGALTTPIADIVGALVAIIRAGSSGSLVGRDAELRGKVAGRLPAGFGGLYAGLELLRATALLVAVWADALARLALAVPGAGCATFALGGKGLARSQG